MGKRRKAREYALMLLYQLDICGSTIEEAKASLNALGIRLDAELHEFVESLARGSLEHLQEIDSLISKYLIDWRIERLAVVDRCILRLAIYEILYMEDIPVSVSINEAVEIAKKYGGEESYRFINGILGSLVKSEGIIKSQLKTIKRK